MPSIYLSEPYPQQITTQDELYKLAYTVVRDVVPGAKYVTRLSVLGWTKDDLASEAYLVSREDITLPIDFKLAWQVLRRDMEDFLKPRKKDKKLTSLSNLTYSADPEATETLGDTILADVVNHSGQHTKSPESLLIEFQTPKLMDLVDPSDLPFFLTTLPELEQSVVNLLFLAPQPATLREAALALKVSRSKVGRVREKAIANLSFIILQNYVGQNRKHSITSVGEVNDLNTWLTSAEDSVVTDSVSHSESEKPSKRRRRHEAVLCRPGTLVSSLEDGSQNSKEKAKGLRTGNL